MRRHRHPARPTALVGAVTVCVLGLAGCGDGGDTMAVETTTSTTTSAPATVSLDSLSDDYCERAEQLSGASMLRLDSDPGTATASIDALALVAPPALEQDYDVVSSQVAALSEAGAEGGAAALNVIDLLVDREFLAALDRIERTTLEQCGVQLAAGLDDDGDD